MIPASFFAVYAPQAQAACKGTGLLASICLAQAALESNWGESGLTKQANNFFGMKASNAWLLNHLPVLNLPTKEQKPTGELYTVVAAFKKFPTAKAAFEDRVALFRRLDRYKSLFKVDDFKSEATLLRKCGYATDIKYPEKLIAIVTKYGLTKYDA